MKVWVKIWILALFLMNGENRKTWNVFRQSVERWVNASNFSGSSFTHRPSSSSFPQNAINSKPYYSYGRPANLLKIPFRVSLKSRKLSRLTSYLWKNWRKNNTIWSRNPHWYGCTLIPYWSVLVDFRAFQGTYGVFQSSVNFETMLTSAKHEPILKSLK